MERRKRNKKGPKGEKFKPHKKANKRQAEDEELKRLTAAIETFDSSKVQTFRDFPLSQRTLNGLRENKYLSPTEIQKEAIGIALQGNDILGAAKTGSGKTLAFLIPVLEKLNSMKWTSMDGLGCLVVSPTRELAYQIFEVIKKVGKHHDFSVGLVIGGKSIKDEAERITSTNIVICTPGRMLQHLEETAFFVADNLQILVLDEADRILDLGFAHTMNAIIESLPPERQTLLFSATQTKSVKDLARLSLKDPVYVSVHEKATSSTPSQLQQSYIVCELHEKISFLWSFIKQHPRTKLLVFISSCKQVRFLHQALQKFRPGIAISALHGGMKQVRRMEVYQEFCRKQHIVLLATDIAARGLDFPAVNWVVQMDCPESVNTYIHRAGRTARYEKDGESILVLMPSEEGMVEKLQEKKIPLNKIEVNPQKLWSLDNKLEYLCASEVTMKTYAQAAFMAYLKNTYFQADKDVFDLKKLDYEKFAFSLGLAITPRVRFLEKQQKMLAERRRNTKEETDDRAILKKTKYKRPVTNSDDEDEEKKSDEEDEKDEEVKVEKKTMKKAEFKVKDETLFESLGDLFSVKAIEGVEEKEDEEEERVKKIEKIMKKKKNVSEETLAKKLIRKKIQVNKRMTFDEEGEVEVDVHKQSLAESKGEKVMDVSEGGLDLEEAQKRLRVEDQHDKKLFYEKVKQKHKEKKLKERMKRQKPRREDEEDEGAELAGASEAMLPDLDRFYGSGSEEEESEEEEEEEEEEESDSEEEDEEDIPAKRRKLLMDDEELALKLLGN